VGYNQTLLTYQSNIYSFYEVCYTAMQILRLIIAIHTKLNCVQCRILLFPGQLTIEFHFNHLCDEDKNYVMGDGIKSS